MINIIVTFMFHNVFPFSDKVLAFDFPSVGTKKNPLDGKFLFIKTRSGLVVN